MSLLIGVLWAKSNSATGVRELTTTSRPTPQTVHRLRSFASLGRASVACGADAPWVLLPTENGETMHLVANLGAGHLVRLRVVQFPGESPEPIRCFDRAQELESRAAREKVSPQGMVATFQQSDHAAQKAEWTWATGRPRFGLDGGDIHVWIEPTYTSLLEGSGLPVGARKRRDEVRSSQEDD